MPDAMCRLGVVLFVASVALIACEPEGQAEPKNSTTFKQRTNPTTAAPTDATTGTGAAAAPASGAAGVISAGANTAAGMNAAGNPADSSAAAGMGGSAGRRGVRR